MSTSRLGDRTRCYAVRWHAVVDVLAHGMQKTNAEKMLSSDVETLHSTPRTASFSVSQKLYS